ncbi:MAG: DUF2062 domain-containing protein [Aquisalimonadaceae bacterium]
MPRKFFRRFLPDQRQIREHRHLRLFGRLLHEPNLWHLNRHSVASGLGIGVFLAFIPMPFQMVVAAAGAILFRVNLPLAVLAVWISNPLTMPPLFYFSYRLGNWLMGTPVRERHFEPTLQWFWMELNNIWQPLYLGSVVCAITTGLATYGLIHLVWRLHIRSHLRRRIARRLRRNKDKTGS